MQFLHKFNNYKILEVLLFSIALLYYLFFFNKGIVLFDEGYFVYSADRILNGEMPYKDFSLQYGPIYFYLLAFFFKLFGSTIIVERFYTVAICLSILVVTFLILNKLRTTSYTIILLSFFCIIAYGYLLINIANIMWANVLTALLTTLTYLYWYSKTDEKKYFYLIIMGGLLALSLALKQNIGVACLVLFNLLITFSKKRPISQTIQDLVIMNGVCIILTLGWIYYFFLKDNISGLVAIIEFSKKFASSISFTIPPLTFIFQPLGLFKLLPYYTPIIFAIFLIYYLFCQKKDWPKFSFALVSVTGFAVTIFPQSDLLHVYPFLGSIMVAILLFGYTHKWKIYIIIFIIINILIGFYLTFFTKSYRYEPKYFQMDTTLPFIRTNGLLIEKQSAVDLISVFDFINSHTTKSDYILAYPYSPMLYFIFERKNPTKDPIYYLRTWHFYDDAIAIKDMQRKNVKYVITAGNYKFDSDLSKFIQKQQQVFTSGSLIIFKIVTWN